ncbi:MAG: hypothetical protein ACRELG_08830, partial [Gemmataceae bacterium]
ALGLTAPPKVAISTNRIDLSGSPGEQLTYSVEIKTQEKRPVYAHATSNEPWLEVGRAKLTGRVAIINLSVPSVPNKEGETLRAKLIVQSNGNQRFVVPVTLQVGNNLAFGAAEPMPSAPALSPVEEITSAPMIVPSTVSTRSSGTYRRRSVKKSPAWIHLVPAALLLLAVVIAVVVDLVMPSAVTPKDDIDDVHPPLAGLKFPDLKDPEPRINVRFDAERERFGVEMPKEKDPNFPDKPKRLTYDDHGKSNNTIIKIDGFEYKFGFKTASNRWGGLRGKLKHEEIKEANHKGAVSTMVFTSENVTVAQHVEVVPGQSGYLDTVLVYYTLKNKDQGKHKVGIRVMLDTFIGANDGVPFTIPGNKGFVNTKAEYSQKKIPDYIEVIENPSDPKNPGTVARMGLRLKLPRMDLDDMDKLRICRFPGQTAGWDWPAESMQAGRDEKQGDSCVAMYWPYITMNPKETRHVAFTYGLSALDISEGGGGSTLALSVPASVQPDSDFVVTAYVWNAKKGDKVKLSVPAGLKLANGENAEKPIEESGARSQVFWHLRSGDIGKYPLEASKDKTKSKPKTVVVKTTSIFG